MATLLIEKNSLNVWTHTPSDFLPYIITQFYAKSNGDNFNVFEFSGVQRGSYNFSDISIKDGVNPIETGFTSVKQVMLRLEELKYVGFEFDGDVVAADLISTDPSNQLTIGTDDLLFVPEPMSGVLTTNTNITSNDLSKQDVDGFVLYINALNPIFTLEANDERTYSVTDSGQKFKILLRGRSFGFSETPITTSDVLELEPFNPEKWELITTTFYAPTLTQNPIGAGLTTTATADDSGTGPVITANLFSNWLRRRFVSAASAGSSILFVQASFRIIKNVTAESFYIFMKFGNEDAATVSTSRNFCGINVNSIVGNVDPSTLMNIFGIGNDSADANYSIMHNDGAGTATKIPLGSSFPAQTNSLDFYTFEIFKFAGLTSLHYRVRNVHNNATAAGQVTTNIPVSGLYFPTLNRNNGSTALAVRMSLSHFIVREKM